MATNSLELEEQLDCDEIYRLISSMSDEEFNRMTDPTHYETHLIPSTQPHPKEPRFAMPKSDEEAASAKQNAVPQNTSKINNWCVAIWEEYNGQQQEGICVLSIHHHSFSAPWSNETTGCPDLLWK